MKITIKEVAELAKVSPSTVSRVISDNSRISEKTKKKVKKAMEELGYYPNAIARSLVRKSTNTLGIVMPQSTEAAFLNPFFSQVLSGIAAGAHEKDYCIILSTGNTEMSQLESIRNIVLSGRVDGVILMYSSVNNIILKEIKKLNIPILIIGKPLEDLDVLYVDNDNFKASYYVTKKLIKKGHKHIGLITGPLNLVVSLDRVEGYKRAIFEEGLDFYEEYIKEVPFTKEAGYRAMKELLRIKDLPTGIIVTDDVVAFGAIDAIKEENYKVPWDIEIISFNNIPLAEFSSPSLSSVDINAITLGYESARLMIKKIENDLKEGENNVIVPTKIIYRESFTELEGE